MAQAIVFRPGYGPFRWDVFFAGIARKNITHSHFLRIRSSNNSRTKERIRKHAFSEIQKQLTTTRYGVSSNPIPLHLVQGGKSCGKLVGEK